jgi:hypothetical protein
VTAKRRHHYNNKRLEKNMMSNCESRNDESQAGTEPASAKPGVPAMAAVTELIDHVISEIKEIDDLLDWNKKIGHRNPSKLKVVRQVYLDNVLVWLHQLRDKISGQEAGTPTS